MAKSKRPTQLVATLEVQKGNTSVTATLPFTRPLTMAEIKLLWDAERALNALPLLAGTRVAIDVNLQ